MPNLVWKHHTLIQTLLSRGPLKEKEFQSIFTFVTGKKPGSHQQLFNDYLLRINKELAFVQCELRCCRNQYDGKIYYGVVNNVADERSKLGTKYSVPQIAFYKGVIKAIVQDATAEGSISNIYALNIRLENQLRTGVGSQSQNGQSYVPSAFTKFSLSQKEKTLDELVRDRWLCSLNGKIGLGVRSFLDLRSWFRNNDITSCEICNEAGVKADLCQNEGCNVRIHHYCLNKKFSQRKVEKVCPGCGTDWPFVVSKVDAVEEDESQEDQDEPSQRQVPSSGSAMRKRRRSYKTKETEAVGGVPSQSSVPVPNLRRTTRRSVRRPVEEDESQEDQDEPSQRQVPSSGSAMRKRRRSYITKETEAVGEVPSQSSVPVFNLRKTTRESVGGLRSYLTSNGSLHICLRSLTKRT